MAGLLRISLQPGIVGKYHCIWLGHYRYSSGFNKDPYKVLGIEKGASKEAIRTAYINLSKEYHPDVQSARKTADSKNAKAYLTLDSPRGSDKFLEISQAYHRLTKPESQKSQESADFRRKQAEAKRQARQRHTENIKWTGFEENPRAWNLFRTLRFVVLSTVLFQLCTVVGYTKVACEYFKIGDDFEEDEHLDSCVQLATESYQKQLQEHSVEKPSFAPTKTS